MNPSSAAPSAGRRIHPADIDLPPTQPIEIAFVVSRVEGGR
jgi:hypothetical protein